MYLYTCIYINISFRNICQVPDTKGTRTVVLTQAPTSKGQLTIVIVALGLVGSGGGATSAAGLLMHHPRVPTIRYEGLLHTSTSQLLCHTAPKHNLIETIRLKLEVQWGVLLGIAATTLGIYLLWEYLDPWGQASFSFKGASTPTEGIYPQP